MIVMTAENPATTSPGAFNGKTSVKTKPVLETRPTLPDFSGVAESQIFVRTLSPARRE